jgi:hypothetical protein
MKARKEMMNSLGVCALDLFVLTCSTSSPSADRDYAGLGEEQNVQRRYSLVLRERNYIGWRFPTKIEAQHFERKY